MNKPWELCENEWEVTESIRVAAWVGGAGVRIGVEGRYLEDQLPSMTLVEAKRMLRKLESAIAWAERAKGAA